MNKSNIEKNFLLNEVHHRVINNLQLVLSILTLEKHLGLKNSDEIVESTMARVSTMSIIYQSAYDVDGLSSLDFKDFIDNNIDKFIRINNGSDINVELDLESGINVDSDILSPLTLILNEIISNSILYAFEEDQEDKTISISLKRTGDKSAYIIFEDNGIGLPEGLDVNNSNSIGFIIINLLASQLGGQFSKLESEGTALKTDFFLEK
ncbi:MAG: sensor histidine kinase [archaeon]|nr:sensor histidine kinase [archaeon]